LGAAVLAVVDELRSALGGGRSSRERSSEDTWVEGLKSDGLDDSLGF
jgi:hypothetical protein